MIVILDGLPKNKVSGQWAITKLVMDCLDSKNVEYCFLNISPNQPLSKWLYNIFFLVKENYAGRVKLNYLVISRLGYRMILDLCLMVLIRKRFVIHLHGRELNDNLGKFYMKFVLNILSMADKVLAISPSMVLELKGKLDNVILLNNPAQFRLDGKIEGKGFHIAYISHVSIEKGFVESVDYVVDLAKANINRNIIFHVAGSMGLDKGLFNKILSKTDLLPNVSFIYHGRLELEPLKQLYSIIDCLIFKSNYISECVPIVVLNAVYNNIPVLANDIGYLTDFLPVDSFQKTYDLNRIIGLKHYEVKGFYNEDFAKALSSVLNEYINC